MALAFGLLFAAFFSVARPWFRTWGATAAEVQRALPGDEIVPSADLRAATTRAITIAAPVGAVWPWLAQLGQDRAGFYSYEVLEDLVGADMPSAERIHPEFQRWQAGDKLWMYPPDRISGMGHALLVRHEPGRVLAFATRRVGTAPEQPHDGSWAFVLEPVDANTTRLLVRGRAAPERGLLGTAFDRMIFDPIHFVMERKMMEGIALRAEGGHGSKLADTLQVALWTATFALFVIAGVSAVRRERWIRPLAAFALSGLVLQALAFVQPPLVVGVMATSAIAALSWLRVPERRKQGASVHDRTLRERAPM